ncbi:hypothetical protein E1091_11240 [Micromonospora fluostatini]|uniref:Flp pilus-assembly TadG-like N-terminal domain-containing protein n=1 Tax=Micromonospora fluostatini TaxID=1629071 RepID=A0ABY2DGB6_9ACTN|nr:hypothetical protein E1091_11240 [Micromonospora fluostatini]
MLAVTALTLVGCADAVDRGRQDARDAALADAQRYVRDAEVAAISRSDLGDGSVRYLRGRLAEAGAQVLGSGSLPGQAEAGPVVGWVDAALTRTSSNTVWAEGATVTTCVRFEVSWSDRAGARYVYHGGPADRRSPVRRSPARRCHDRSGGRASRAGRAG